MPSAISLTYSWAKQECEMVYNTDTLILRKHYQIKINNKVDLFWLIW